MIFVENFGFWNQPCFPVPKYLMTEQILKTILRKNVEFASIMDQHFKLIKFKMDTCGGHFESLLSNPIQSYC